MLADWYSAGGVAVHPLLVAMLALAIDALLGDPPRLYDRLPHPVALFGGLAARVEARANRPGLPGRSRFGRGAAACLALVGLAAGIGVVLQSLLARIEFGWMIAAALASTLVAYRGLHDRARDVADGLDQSLDRGRSAVGHLVGRDPDGLDEHGVARAAVESTAENLSDGVVAPLLWFAILGLPGLCACKAINTLDSMFGHRDDRYEEFGKLAARLDDAVNAVPARATALLVVAAAAAGRDASAGAAWTAMVRDGPKHRSVNAGWPEAAMAGALGLALGGPRRYGGRVVDDAWLNPAGRKEAGARDVRRALRVYRRAAAALAAGLLLAMALLA